MDDGEAWCRHYCCKNKSNKRRECAGYGQKSTAWNGKKPPPAEVQEIPDQHSGNFLALYPSASAQADGCGYSVRVSMCRFLPEHLSATVGFGLQFADNVPGMALTFRSASSGRVD
jgi:hypothetical protein